MNCQEFDHMLNDLTSGRPMEARQREHALAHAGVCVRCATRLSHERVLTTGLRALAEETASVQAAPQLRQSLRAAFLQHHAQQQESAPAEVIAFPAARVRQWSQWAMAAAAAIILLLAGAALISTQIKSNNLPEQANDRKTVPASGGTSNPAMVPQSTPSPEPMPDKIAQVEQKPVRKPARRTPRRVLPSNETNETTVTAQATTEFIPLTYISDAASLQSGLIVRVEVPRATLVAMGLPVNAARSDSLIKADVVMSDDGVARAIRFVQ